MFEGADLDDGRRRLKPSLHFSVRNAYLGTTDHLSVHIIHNHSG